MRGFTGLLGLALLLVGVVLAAAQEPGLRPPLRPAPVAELLQAPAAELPPPTPLAELVIPKVDLWPPESEAGGLLIPGVRLWPPKLPPPPKLWHAGLEMGISGAEGNSENMKIRIGGNVKRATPYRVFNLEFLYSMTTQNRVRSENRSIVMARQVFPLPDIPWSVFLSGQSETDEFQAYDVRFSTHAGAGYDLFRNPRAFMKSRIGAGTSREIGGAQNRFIPEALFGLDAEWKVTERQRLTASADFFPEVGRWGDYRIQARASYEILVDPQWNLTLKFGVFNRYDSTPEGRRPNDLDYSAVLLWKF